MQKIVGFIAILFSFIIAPYTVSAYEHEDESNTLEILDETSPMATPPAAVKYDLAFPGILPDSPLYKLKVLRDKISIYFIFDPKEKIDYLLLQTDKGILASAMLVDKGKNALAVETALKAENNYTLLVQELGGLSQKPDEAFFEKLQTAALKHQEVLANLSNRVKGDEKKTFEIVKDFSERNVETVNKFKNTNELRM